MLLRGLEYVTSRTCGAYTSIKFPDENHGNLEVVGTHDRACTYASYVVTKLPTPPILQGP